MITVTENFHEQNGLHWDQELLPTSIVDETDSMFVKHKIRYTSLQGTAAMMFEVSSAIKMMIVICWIIRPSVCPHTKLHMCIRSRLLVTVSKPEAKYRFRVAAMLLIYITKI
jgi:hypothetical protein